MPDLTLDECVERLSARFDAVEASTARLIVTAQEHDRYFRGHGPDEIGIFGRLDRMEGQTKTFGESLTGLIQSQNRVLWGIAAGVGTLIVAFTWKLLETGMH